MTTASDLLTALEDLVGPAHVMTDLADLNAYRADGRGGGGDVPLALVRPADAASVSAVVRLAAAHGVRLIVQGGQTGLVGAGLANASNDLLLNLDRLNRHIEIDPINRTATVDAGVRLSALNSAAAQHGLMFPIDLGADPAIGGMISANTGGARLLRYGDMRSNLMSLDFVRSEPAGTLISLGAALWKNNVGLDLKQLLVGSSGSLGVVTRATVKLQALPAARVSALLALRCADDALPLLLALEAGFGGLLSAFEGISLPAYAAAFAHAPSLQMPFKALPAYAVLVEISSGSAFDEDMLEERLAATLSPFMEGEGPAIQDVAIDRKNRLWAIRHALSDGLRAAGEVVACDIAVRRGEIMRFRELVAARVHAAVPDLELHDFGHIGDGGLHFNFVWPTRLGSLDPVVADRVRTIVFDAAVREFGGSFSAEHGVGPRNLSHYLRYAAADVRDLAGSVQRLVAPIEIGRVDFGTKGLGE